MGCQSSTSLKGGNRVFGQNGFHVGREGDVNLTSRSMDVFGVELAELIRSDKLHTARRLHLSNNRLYTMGRDLKMLPSIEELFIDENRFERLPAVLSELHELRVLNASMNPLGIQDHALTVLPRIQNLTSVILRDCSLRQIPPCLLCCASLKELDLSDNTFLQFDNVDFSSLRSLQQLKIANCGITGPLPLGVKEIKTLKALDISSNEFQFDETEFFGKKLPKTLTELHLRAMHLTSVPQVICSLYNLHYLDLAENAVETLDCLAGRMVRKYNTRNGAMGGINAPLIEGTEDALSVDSRASTRMSVAQASRIGCIAHVAQPIPLRKLSLRACGLRTLPKYFHKLTKLVSIDLSYNDHLDDPNMTLFSFINLEELNIVECPFALNPRISRNEWYDIAKLRNLHTLNWEKWRSARNISPYRTKIPLEICGLNLSNINGVKIRPGLFVGDTVQTTINLLSDGYFKVDVAMEDDLPSSHMEAVRLLQPLESFFFSDMGVGLSGGSGMKKKEASTNCARFAFNRRIRSQILQIVINRYIFFLTIQAANYGTVIIPPADVMAIHYAQMTQDPLRYRLDCEAICGQVVSCNYRLFFLEQKMRPNSVKEALSGSRHVWNMMVRAAQKQLHWLHYEFWECFSNDSVLNFSAVSESAHSDKQDKASRRDSTATERPLAPALPPSSVLDSVDFGHIDSNKDICSMLDISITAHFREQGTDRFATSLEKFFVTNTRFLQCDHVLKKTSSDWTLYVKYLALYTQIERWMRPEDMSKPSMNTLNEVPNFSFVAPDAYLPLPLSTEMLTVTSARRSHSALIRRPVPINNIGGEEYINMTPHRSISGVVTKHTNNNNVAGNRQVRLRKNLSRPFPTIGIMLMLHSHRTAHEKYYQALVMLGIENVDIQWEETLTSAENTMKAWMMLFKERYVLKPESLLCHGESLDTEEPTRGSLTTLDTASSASSSKRTSRSQRHVLLCCTDPEDEHLT